MLSVEGVLESSVQIRALFRANPEEYKAWAASMAQACGFMDPIQFHEVCKVFLPEMTAGRTPAPKQLIAVFHKLKTERGWDRDTQECRGCRGTFHGIVLLRKLDTGEVGEFARPCPMCQGGKPFLPREGWEQIQSSQDQYVRQASAMSPAAARRALAMLDDRNAKIREDVLLVLVQRASEAPIPGEPPIRRLADVIGSVLPEAFDPSKYKTGGVA